MLELRNIVKSYEGKPLLTGVSFDVGESETVCLLGASGSGKSTLLRIISGLEQAEGGQVLWDGKDLKDVPVHLRRFGLMFQDYALFPHRSVAENVAFGLKMQNRSREEITTLVQSALEQVNLDGFGSRRVTDLSGGEQQRVALARALAPRPRLLMLDEPLGALDRTLREQLIAELHELLHQTGIPAIYVTHDQEEAFALADRLVLLHQGRVEQIGPPREVYARPVSTWAARFLGLTNLLPGKILNLEPLTVETCLGVLQVGHSTPAGLHPGDSCVLLVRPTAALQPQLDDLNRVTLTVVDSAFRGLDYRVVFSCSGGQRLEFFLDAPHSPGGQEEFSLRPGELLLLTAGEVA